MKNNIEVFARSKAEIEKDCRAWAEEIGESYAPDIIVFIAKSGFLFAKPIAEYFGCPMVGISVSRPGNDRKDTFRRFIPWIPQWMLFALLKSKANYSYQEGNSNREVRLDERLKKDNKWEIYKNILLIDDSTDTGFSLIEAKKVVQCLAPESRIKTASYCVIDISEKRVVVDFCRYRNTIVVSATSRYSKENDSFNKAIADWKNSGGIM